MLKFEVEEIERQIILDRLKMKAFSDLFGQ